jgi:hypothetical protein
MVQLVDQYKSVVLTQGGADAFVQGSITTDIIPADGEGWLLSRIEIQFDPTALAALSADASIIWSGSRDSQTAVRGYNDADAFYVGGRVFSLTTSGTYQQPLVEVFDPPVGTIFVEPTMYFQLDSTATGGIVIATFRVHYTMVKLTEIEILRILQSQ